MSNTNVTLTINTTEDGDQPNSSNTVIQTDSLAELHRMLDLAGVPGAYNYATTPGVEAPEEVGAEVEEQETYKPSASNQVRKPDHKINNPRFADNSLEEDMASDLELANVNPHYITDTYANYLAFTDHDEAVARTADEFGITGEAVEQVIADARRAKEQAKEFSEDFNDYNQVEPGEEAPPAPKGFKDYLSDLGAEREVQHADKQFKVKVEWMDSNYDSQFEEEVVTAGTAKEAEQAVLSHLKVLNNGKLNVLDTEVEEFVGEAYGSSNHARRGGFVDSVALLPIERMMVTLDDLENNEYFGDGLRDGNSGIVCFAIETGDKPRLTYASTWGDATSYKAGERYMTYHDQTGKERPATVVTSFNGDEYMDPKGRIAIKNRMASGGMDPRKKYSVRVFK